MNDKSNELSRSLKNRHIQLIAIGGAIGTGLFLGSGTAIHEAGPSIILAYIITGIFCFFLMRSVGELLLSDIKLHSFIDFVGRHLGQRAEFVTGWTYWFCWLSIAMADLTASGIYMHFWLPHLPQWITPLIILVILLFANLITVGLFGEMESWFSMVKVIAIILLIVVGLYMIFIGYKTTAGAASFANLFDHGGFFPTGGKGFLISFQMVVFAFVGIEMVGVTAGETENPSINLPKAVNNLPWRIGIFYVGSMIVIMSVYPWTQLSATQSPFVQVFADVGIRSAAGIVNFVVLTAAFSATNSALFTTSRTLYSLSHGGDAPKFFQHLSRSQVPSYALLFSSSILLIVVVLNYVMPKGVFQLISGVSTINFIFVWSVLMLTHLVYKREASRGDKLSIQTFKMPFFPYSSYLTLLFFAMVAIILFAEKSTRVSLVISVVWFVVMFVVYEFVKSLRRK